MAEYKTSRKIGYAATLKTAPAFSFPKESERRVEDPGPGPGAYGASFDYGLRKGATIGTGLRGKLHSGDPNTPSPLDYAPTARVLKSAPSYSFGGKADTGQKSKTPGPGAYNERYSAVKPSMPAVSIAFKPTNLKQSDRTPGPNEYRLPAQQFNTTGPAASIKFRNEGAVTREAGPGPGEYVVRKEPDGDGKSFGVSRTEGQLEIGSPGPAHYTPNEDGVRSKPTAWTTGRGPRDSYSRNNNPGPGTYQGGGIMEHAAGHGEVSDLRSVPAYTFAGKTPAGRIADAPGPSDYGRPVEVMRRSAPSFTFRKKTDPDCLKNKNPGPGAYDEDRGYKAVRPSMAKISLANRIEESKQDRGPAPNEYCLPSQSWDSTAGGVTMKFRHERASDIWSPAPHDYADKDLVRSPYQVGYVKKGYSFGVRHKAETREVTPSPHYRVGCTTLGIAAAEPMFKQEIDRVAVL